MKGEFIFGFDSKKRESLLKSPIHGPGLITATSMRAPQDLPLQGDEL
jgi:hypothetical protein